MKVSLAVVKAPRAAAVTVKLHARAEDKNVMLVTTSHLHTMILA
jgi:hypothetical protein